MGSSITAAQSARPPIAIHLQVDSILFETQSRSPDGRGRKEGDCQNETFLYRQTDGNNRMVSTCPGLLVQAPIA